MTTVSLGVNAPHVVSPHDTRLLKTNKKQVITSGLETSPNSITRMLLFLVAFRLANFAL